MGSIAPYTTIALVTGANQGIGFEIAKKLSTEHKDYHVIMTGRRKDALDEAVAKLEALGLSVEGVVLDVNSDESIAQAAKFVEEKYGRLDVLINNAGITNAPAAEGESPRKQWQAVFDTNVVGVVVITDAFIPLLEKSQAPTKRIVMMSSQMGSLASKLDRDIFFHKYEAREYSSTKAALNMLALHYAVRYEDDPTWKININCPGYVATNINKYAGVEPVENGAVNACRLAALTDLKDESGTYSNRHGKLEW
ncbi:short chain dehydrogenase [Diplogelasinospora grovesii]|uniref:Short chain dehydrogenase n=1 Tax=Diplogelasinospora grovesii TaxID=303347 RepID=A0AAN6ND71_9PEZI|nr:short chain dehydrogenase [Diplogelasinospora grovesii]